jgi:hypothetical protein
MSNGQDALSCGGADGSIAWDDVVELGNRIASEMGEGEGPELLRLWVSHRIAELIEQAEHAKRKQDREEARKACAELVLKAWRLFRVARLLADIRQALRWVEPGREEEYQPSEELPARAEEVLAALRQLTCLEGDLCLAGILAERPDEDASDDEGAEGEDQGHGDLDVVGALRASTFREIARALGGFGDVDFGTPEATRRTVIELLHRLSAERQRLLTRLAELTEEQER